MSTATMSTDTPVGTHLAPRPSTSEFVTGLWARKARIWPRKLRPRSPQLSQFVAALIAFEADLQVWRFRGESAAELCAAVETNLDVARTCAGHRRFDEGWAALDAAERAAIGLRSAAGRNAVAAATRSRAQRVLPGWRSTAVLDLLGADAAGGGHAGVEQLTEALRQLAGHTADVTARLRLVNRRVLVATAMLLVALAVLGLSTSWHVPDMVTQGPALPVLSEWKLYVITLLLGVIGGMLSIALPDPNDPHLHRAYELSGTWFVIPIARLAVAGASGVVAALFVEAGVIGLGPAWAVLIAVPAGFTERFVARLLTSMATDAEREVPPGPGRAAPPATPPSAAAERASNGRGPGEVALH